MSAISSQTENQLPTRTVRVRITGTVQGVGYRQWTARMAIGLGISGWVRNRFDGSVEALFHGQAEAVTQMLVSCERGPALATVEAVCCDDPSAAPPDQLGFETRPTV